jgi:hypothetical protein
MEIRFSYRNQNQKKFNAILCFVYSLILRMQKGKTGTKKNFLTLENNLYRTSIFLTQDKKLKNIYVEGNHFAVPCC